MSKEVDEMNCVLQEFEDSPEGKAYGLRMDVSEIVCAHMNKLGWEPKDLAAKAGLPEQTVVKMLGCENDYTIDKAGRLFHALGCGKVELVERAKKRGCR